MVPIRRCSHFKPDVESEADALNLNVVMPEGVGPTARLPVMVWIHGGSFIFGAATHPGYDMVNLVSFSNARGTPIVGVSINYRVGLFGFLASAAIRDDLAKDGFKGVGNFGLTDQQTALDWVQRYIGAFGGDPGNVTIFGESAGGMSVCHHTWAANPATFHRGISMSGSLHTWPVWSLEQHERRWNVLLKRFGIDPLASDALDRLRDVPEAEIAVATCPIEGTIDATGNMCDDGWFYASSPSPGKYTSPPAWLNSFMIGNVTHEGMIFSHNLSVQTLELARQRLSIFLKEPEIELVLRAYGINPSASTDDWKRNLEQMVADGLFGFLDRRHAQASEIPTYAYHFDQKSTLDGLYTGLAHHAIDIGYVFLNMKEQMTDGQRRIASKVAGDFLDFAYGREPWEQYNKRSRWMRYGPDDTCAMISEEEAEPVRKYSRMNAIVNAGIFESWVTAMDDLANVRWMLGSAAKALLSYTT